MKKLYKYLGTTALTLLVASNVNAAFMSDLFAGDSITAGDKVFDSWELLFEDSLFGTQPDYGSIDVTALNDGGLDPGPGLDFDFGNGLTVVGDDLYAFTDFKFGFHVSTIGNLLIKDVSLGGLNFSTSRTVDGSNDLGFTIVETVYGSAADYLAGVNALAIIDVGSNVLDDVTSFDATDSAVFAALDDVWITKNILVWSQDSTDSVTLSGFNQRYSQVEDNVPVPVPSTIALIALGLLGVGLRRRR